MRSANATAAGLVAVIVAAAGVVGWSFSHRDQRSRADWREAWVIAAPQNLAPSTVRTVVLPPRLATLTVDGTAQLWRTHDGRAYLIGKTAIGYKGNWRGMLYGPAPLAPNELYRGAGGRMTIGPDERDFALEATVTHARGNGLYEIAFDLN
jgi:hypothetical protein